MITYEIERGIDKNVNFSPFTPDRWKWFMFAIHNLSDVYTAGFVAGYWGGAANPYFYGTDEHDAYEVGEIDGSEWRFYVESQLIEELTNDASPV